MEPMKVNQNKTTETGYQSKTGNKVNGKPKGIQGIQENIKLKKKSGELIRIPDKHK